MTRTRLPQEVLVLVCCLFIVSSLVACAQPITPGPTPTLGGPYGPVAPSPTPVPPTPTAAAAPAGEPAPRPGDEQGDVRTLNILYTNDTRGYVDPCG